MHDVREEVRLAGVPETMLWTLHNRAGEARRANAFLHDPACVRIYESIAFDYERCFGKPEASHPMRSRLFDDVVRPWMAAHPGGTVVELAAGLETQFQRCDDGRVRWLCVDVPEAIAVRERFLPPSPRCRYIAKSALDFSWLEEVDPSHGVFVTAQGLLMYFEEPDVRRLFTAIVDRLPHVELMFDTIPRWFSKKTMQGFGRTRHYKAPPMPWGVGRGELDALLRQWSTRVATVRTQPYGFARGPGRALVWLCAHVPWLQSISPAIAHVITTGSDVAPRSYR
jgi:O-methyltransferase involved in polyketide biosynthesis